jgi:hypothetical protein
MLFANAMVINVAMNVGSHFQKSYADEFGREK